MMKETKLSPLLIFLMVTVTPRENSATPIASPAFFSPSPAVFPRTPVGSSVAGAPSNIPSVIVNNMAEGADLLTETFTWLQNNMLTSQFEESVRELEAEISKLPFEFAANRFAVLKGVYMAQDEINQTRNYLTLAAKQLKGYCEELIYYYNNSEITMKLLTHTSNRFLEYANRVKNTLDMAKNDTKKVQVLLSEAKAFLFKLNATLKKNKELETQPITIRIRCIGLCDISLVFNGLGKRVDIKPAQQASDALNSHVDVVRQYLTKELNLIINWQGRLTASISDVAELENIPVEFILIHIKVIKGRLGVLANACEEYINHKLPGILLKGVSSITPGK